jgi:putative ABC transport system permease protein
MGRLLLIAVRNLLKNKRRTFLLGGAITIVTMLLILLGSVGNGIQDTMLTAGTAMSTGHVNVGGFYKVTSGQAAPLVTKAKQLRKDIEELVPEATRITARELGWGKIISHSDSLLAAPIGVDPAGETELADVLTIVEGSFNDLVSTDYNTVMLFQSQATRLNVHVGDEVTLSAPIMKGQNNSLDVRVACIAKDMGLISMMRVFVSIGTLRDLYQLDPDTTGVYFVFLDDPNDAEEVMGRLRAGLLDKDYEIMERLDSPFFHKFDIVQGEAWTGQKLDLTTWEGALSNMEWTVDTFATITTILIGILLVIIIVGVMNAMWIAVRDRTREIGTMRAIGMSTGKVLVMFLMEAFMLSAGATLLGVGSGIIVTHLLNAAQIPVSEGFQIFLMSDTLRLVVAPDSVVKALVIIPLLTTVGAWFPARRGARLKPVTAMYHVG